MFIDGESKYENKLVAFEKIPYGGVFQSSGRTWLKSGEIKLLDGHRIGIWKDEAVDVKTGERIYFEPNCHVTPHPDASIHLGEPGALRE